MKRMQAIVAAHPQDPDAWSALGSLQRSAKEFEDAGEILRQGDRAARNARTRATGRCSISAASASSARKQWPKAEADFKKALELYPDQPLVLNYLGYSWVDQGVNLDEAFKMLRRAVDLKPTDGYIVDSLGWAHFKLGHYEEAAQRTRDARSS